MLLAGFIDQIQYFTSFGLEGRVGMIQVVRMLHNTSKIVRFLFVCTAGIMMQHKPAENEKQCASSYHDL